MLRLKNYAWILVLATGLLAVVYSSDSCCTEAPGTRAFAASVPIADAGSETKGGVVNLDEKTFDEAIKEGITLVDFAATWCAPCRMQEPIIEAVSMYMFGKASICKLDVDQSPRVASRYNVRSIPTIIIFKDGQAVSQFLGVTSKEVIVSEINNHLQQ